MLKVDQATVKALQLKAPWASTIDAENLRHKVLGGEIFCLFSQQEREQIMRRLQNYKEMVPSLFEFFENLKCLEAWADCLKWLIRLDPRETVFMAMKKIYPERNQHTDSALVQESETVFQTVPTSPEQRLDLAYRQLYSFAMRFYRDIPKKPTGKELLARSIPTVNTSSLREMADLASRLGFESAEISALREHPKSADLTGLSANHRPSLVTEGPGEAPKYRCGISPVEDYEENRKYMFIPYLHDNRQEQGEGITYFFRFRSMYLKFFGMPYSGPGDNGGVNSDGQQPSVIVQLGTPALDTTSSADLPECDQMHESEATITDENMDDSGEADERASVQRRPAFLSETSFSEGEIHQSEQIIPPISRESIPFQGQLEQQQSRNMPTSSASATQEQEQEQEQEHQQIQERHVEQLREESSDELNRRKEDHMQVQREGRISRLQPLNLALYNSLIIVI